MRWRHLSWLGLIFCLALPALAVEPPPDYNAFYVIKKGFVELGTARRSLKRIDEHTLQYESETSSRHGMLSAVLKFEELKQSRIEWRDGHLRPLHYSHKREGINAITIEQDYDWKQRQVSARWGDGDKLTYDVPADAYDQNMFQLALMLDAQQGRLPLDYHLAENRRMKTYNIREVRRETVETDLGSFETRVISTRDNGSETMMWCAEALHFLPVRIEYQDGGMRIRAELNRVEGLR